MKWFVYSPRYSANFGEHVFRTAKYRLLTEKLLKEGILKEEEIVEPEPASWEDLLLVHTPEYIDDLRNLRWSHRTIRSELPLTQEIIDFFRLASGGTYMASSLALENGLAFHNGGGFHHAYEDHAEGFCYINDIAYAIKKLQKEGKIRRAAVIDCDVHQGNGTAHIFRNDPDVFTFSIHQEMNYPMPKEKSDWDIGLPDRTSDQVYNTLLKEAVIKIYEEHSPELVIYVAGADPYLDDLLGGLSLTKEGLKERDEIVIGEAVRRGIPLVVVLAGGYARKVEDLVDIHYNTAVVLRKHLDEIHGT